MNVLSILPYITSQKSDANHSCLLLSIAINPHEAPVPINEFTILTISLWFFHLLGPLQIHTLLKKTLITAKRDGELTK